MKMTQLDPKGQIKRMFDVRSPMRDGVELSSDIWLPDGEGGIRSF